MDTPRPSMTAEIEALRRAYAALNRGDVAGFVAGFDAAVERVEPSDFPQGGEYRGLDAVRAHVAKGRGSWAEGSCEPVRFIVAPPSPAGDRVIVLAHVRVRLKSETEWREGDIADVFTFRAGKVVQFRTFGDVGEGLAWAGVMGSDAEVSARIEREPELAPGSTHADLRQAIAEFVGAFEVVFRYDWAYTKDMIGDEAEGATFIEPGLEDEIEDWGSRGALLETYRKLVSVMKSHGMAPIFRPYGSSPTPDERVW